MEKWKMLEFKLCDWMLIKKAIELGMAVDPPPLPHLVILFYCSPMPVHGRKSFFVCQHYQRYIMSSLQNKNKK